MSVRLDLFASAKKVRAYLAAHPEGVTFEELSFARDLESLPGDFNDALDLLVRQQLVRVEEHPSESLYDRYFVKSMEAPQ